MDGEFDWVTSPVVALLVLIGVPLFVCGVLSVLGAIFL